MVALMTAITAGCVNLPGDDAGNEDDEDEEDEEEEYSDAPTVGYQESELNFGDFVRRFISDKTLQICGILLEKFETNSVHTNHCIVKLLHRIAVDCGMPAMLFQASLFRIFQRAMSSPNPEHKEMRRFGRFIVQKFLETAETNSKVFIEMLFWKKVKDAVEITEGYGSTSTKSYSVKNLWTEEQEDELTRLCNEFMSTNPPGSNPVDWIMENLINRDRSRVSVIKKLKELHLWSRESVAELKRSAREWSQEEEDQLRELVPEFLNAESE
ncbi:hypothetical protein LSTR_LSTR015432 [Laodelphax striatellus]|uniref:Uncharacterized protein n=1 Tax=Laodelphax striatellus TaxID=195883 RepID=A0A482XRB6_LAOST|nr:hypothetical protein LSTR_LSTR015432 [Laodelphax striatellus]